jgi:hypothetical protein
MQLLSLLLKWTKSLLLVPTENDKTRTKLFRNLILQFYSGYESKQQRLH